MFLLLSLDTTQIILICLIAVLLVAYPIIMIVRNKKENQKVAERTNSLKKGDKVLTTSGVYGKIVDIRMEGNAKQVTIETGSGNYKSYMTVDAYAIYSVISDQLPVAKDVTSQTNQTEKPVEEIKEDKKDETQSKTSKENTTKQSKNKSNAKSKK